MDIDVSSDFNEKGVEENTDVEEASKADEPDDDNSGCKVLDGFWQDWAGLYSHLVGLDCPRLQERLRAIRVGTLCSGTDAPVKALADVVGEANIDHVYSCDISQPAKDFIGHNFRPAHMLSDLADILKTEATRLACEGMCQALREEVDILVCGFPCKLHSHLSSTRWTRTCDEVWRHKYAQPFLHVARAL